MDKEIAKRMKQIGVMKMLKTFRNLCGKCRAKSIRAVQTKKQDTVFDTYCDECKNKILELDK